MLLAALVVSASLTYPIAGLGNCDSPASCKTYCRVPWHQTVCTEYGVEQGLVELPKGQVLQAVSISYPIPELGNCGSKTACRAYCDLPANRTACLNFASARGIDVYGDRPGGDLTGLTFPIPELGNCGSVQECKTYCDQPQNRQACFNFAYEKGLVGGEKAAEKLSGLTFPIAELGNCGSLAECEVYCNQPDHHQACNAYAKAHGFEPQGGMAGPGGCSTSEECDAYCSNPAHREECDAAWQKYCAPHPDWPKCQKGPGGGPGGCTSDEECRAYCEAHPDDEECRRGREEWCQQHPDECKGFEGPGGCMSEEECRLYCEQNPDDAECRRGHEEWCREHPDECQGPPAGEAGPPEGGEGPGPGEGPDECGGMDCAQFCRENPDDEYCQRKNEEYCREHPEECGPPAGETGPPPGEEGPPKSEGPPEGGGPGGCKSEEECRAYCSSHPNDPQCQGGPPQ